MNFTPPPHVPQKACDLLGETGGGNAKNKETSVEEAAPVEESEGEIATIMAEVAKHGKHDEGQSLGGLAAAPITVEITNLGQTEEEEEVEAGELEEGQEQQEQDKGEHEKRAEKEEEEEKEEQGSPAIAIRNTVKTVSSSSSVSASASSFTAVTAALTSAPSATRAPVPTSASPASAAIPAISATRSAPEHEWRPLPVLLAEDGVKKAQSPQVVPVVRAPATGKRPSFYLLSASSFS